MRFSYADVKNNPGIASGVDVSSEAMALMEIPNEALFFPRSFLKCALWQK